MCMKRWFFLSMQKDSHNLKANTRSSLPKKQLGQWYQSTYTVCVGSGDGSHYAPDGEGHGDGETVGRLREGRAAGVPHRRHGQPLTGTVGRVHWVIRLHCQLGGQKEGLEDCKKSKNY